MADAKLTHNARFFKEKDRGSEHGKDIMRTIQHIINEYIQYQNGNQSQNTMRTNVKRLRVVLTQLQFSIEEMSREIECTPLFIQG